MFALAAAGVQCGMIRLCVAALFVSLATLSCEQDCAEEHCATCQDGPINIELKDEVSGDPIVGATVTAGGAPCEENVKRGPGHYLCPGEAGSTIPVFVMATGYRDDDTIISLPDGDTEGCCNCPPIASRVMQLQRE
jgi:hypothetical protein